MNTFSLSPERAHDGRNLSGKFCSNFGSLEMDFVPRECVFNARESQIEKNRKGELFEWRRLNQEGEEGRIRGRGDAINQSRNGIENCE